MYRSSKDELIREIKSISCICQRRTRFARRLRRRRLFFICSRKNRTNRNNGAGLWIIVLPAASVCLQNRGGIVLGGRHCQVQRHFKKHRLSMSSMSWSQHLGVNSNRIPNGGRGRIAGVLEASKSTETQKRPKNISLPHPCYYKNVTGSCSIMIVYRCPNEVKVIVL